MAIDSGPAFEKFRSLLLEAISPLSEQDAAIAADISSGGGAVSVQSGLAWPRLCARPQAPGNFRPPPAPAPQARFVDTAGNSRRVYRPLTVYSWLRAFESLYEKLPQEQFAASSEALQGWCDLLQEQVSECEWPADAMPARRGDEAAAVAWAALALDTGGEILVRQAWRDLASDLFGHIAHAQQPDGGFLRSSPADHPESLWYHELVILHAAAAFAIQSLDRTVAVAVRRNTEFHFALTQPDHATLQPWGIFAFIWNPATRTLAEQMLHGLRMRPDLRGDASDAVTLMLLADALHSVRRFDPQTASEMFDVPK